MSGGEFEFLELTSVPEAVCEHMSPWNSLYLSETFSLGFNCILSGAVCAQYKSLELTALYPAPSVHSVSPWKS